MTCANTVLCGNLQRNKQTKTSKELNDNRRLKRKVNSNYVLIVYSSSCVAKSAEERLQGMIDRWFLTSNGTENSHFSLLLTTYQKSLEAVVNDYHYAKVLYRVLS